MSPADSGEGFTLPAPDSKRFLNRELSLVAFNRRVLAQARNRTVPILERLFFLTVTSTNLDEFFEVRAASHRERSILAPGSLTIDGRTPAETLAAISKRVHKLVKEQYEVLNKEILPDLAKAGIHLLRRNEWSNSQRNWVSEYFKEQVLPVLTPIGLDQAHPFPKILNKSLNFILALEGTDALGRNVDLAVVQVPRALPRVIEIPIDVGKGESNWILLSSVIHANIHTLFNNVNVNGCYQFRVTRDGDLWVDEEEVEDLLTALQGELPERRYARAVRLEVAEDCPKPIARYLLAQFELEDQDLYRVKGPVNLHRLGALCDSAKRPDLKYRPHTPRIPRRWRSASSVFEVIRSQDIVLHHPYESFGPVLELLQAAAQDEKVLAIKQTLYRTGPDSTIAEALIEAAKRGKQVTAVIELRARFDEAHNIELATRLQEVGASVTYGIVGFKTHAKALMVVRRENGQLQRYCHLGTGNYHPKTARAYTDIGYLTAKPEIGEDLHRFFTQLTGVGDAPELTHLIQSPFQLLTHLLECIDSEMQEAENGRPAQIVAKVNALTEPRIIRALYRASQAGVQIDLIVRGACCLRPGIKGLSETIRVRSILGRFLEHSRLFFFHARGERKLFAASADWMTRNLIRRVELCFPILDEKIKERVLRNDLLNYLDPNVLAWESDAKGKYFRTPVEGEDAQAFDVQSALLEHYQESGPES